MCTLKVHTTTFSRSPYRKVGTYSPSWSTYSLARDTKEYQMIDHTVANHTKWNKMNINTLRETLPQGNGAGILATGTRAEAGTSIVKVCRVMVVVCFGNTELTTAA